MKYKLSVAILISSAYGDSFDRDARATPGVWAENLDDADVIQEELNKTRKNWRSYELPSIEKGRAAANTAITQALTARLGVPVVLEDEVASYNPIYDNSGQVVGHDTVAWISVNGNDLFKTVTYPDKNEVKSLSFFGCILYGVVPV